MDSSTGRDRTSVGRAYVELGSGKVFTIKKTSKIVPECLSCLPSEVGREPARLVRCIRQYPRGNILGKSDLYLIRTLC